MEILLEAEPAVAIPGDLDQQRVQLQATWQFFTGHVLTSDGYPEQVGLRS